MPISCGDMSSFSSEGSSILFGDDLEDAVAHFSHVRSPVQRGHGAPGHRPGRPSSSFLTVFAKLCHLCIKPAAADVLLALTWAFIFIAGLPSST